jgi:hypothetical protein
MLQSQVWGFSMGDIRKLTLAFDTHCYYID